MLLSPTVLELPRVKRESKAKDDTEDDDEGFPEPTATDDEYDDEEGEEEGGAPRGVKRSRLPPSGGEHDLTSVISPPAPSSFRPPSTPVSGMGAEIQAWKNHMRIKYGCGVEVTCTF